jgi:hypothetical protein
MGKRWRVGDRLSTDVLRFRNDMAACLTWCSAAHTDHGVRIPKDRRQAGPNIAGGKPAHVRETAMRDPRHDIDTPDLTVSPDHGNGVARRLMLGGAALGSVLAAMGAAAPHRPA